MHPIPPEYGRMAYCRNRLPISRLAPVRLSKKPKLNNFQTRRKIC
jgi:hypothetical protein